MHSPSWIIWDHMDDKRIGFHEAHAYRSGQMQDCIVVGSIL